MALSSIPNINNIGNTFSGLPSAGGINSLNSGSSLLGGGSQNYSANAAGGEFTQNLLNRNGLDNLPSGLQSQASTFTNNFRGQISQPNTFTNPQARLITDLQDNITTQQQLGLGNVIGENPLGKLNLDGLTNQLGGGLGSGLNAFSQTNGILNNATGDAQSLLGGAGSALGGIGNPINTNVAGASAGITSLTGGTLGGLQSSSGSTSNITADISGALGKLTGGGLASGISSLAGTVSKAAGNLGNILSLIRGSNLPAGGELFKQSGSPIKLNPGAKDDWRLRLTCQWSIFNSPLFKLLENTGGLVWPYLPTVSVSTTANYSQIDPVHNNQPYQAYKNSEVNEISIDGEFSAETETDAAYWIAATTFLRTATKMFYGQGEYAGNPPIVCNLTGYGTSIFDKVPVIVKSFNITLGNDVNYVKCNTFGTNTWVPVLSSMSCTVQPVYSRERLRKFNLQDFAKGKTVDPDGVGYI